MFSLPSHWWVHWDFLVALVLDDELAEDTELRFLQKWRIFFWFCGKEIKYIDMFSFYFVAEF
jgi:hypothetical protein